MMRIRAIFAATALVLATGTALAADASQQLQQMIQQLKQASQAAADKRADMARDAVSKIQASALAKAAAPKGLSAAQMARLNAIRARIAGNPQSPAAVLGDWQSLVSDKSMKGKGGDVPALVMYAMQDQAKAAAQDLKVQADRIRATNDKKAQLRNRLQDLRKLAGSKLPASPDRIKIEAQIKQVGAQQDKLNEFGQAEALQLQQKMDQYTKAMQTLSNVSKKMHDTAAAIIANLK